jgi:2-polyprenyl-6-methoxyphenol hydroxylase-like FAD-dependent oxidoreductase
MSPVAGVGINLAIQDAVAAANILATPLKDNRVSVDDLRKVQKRREWPVRVTQQLQLMIQKRLIARALQSDASFAPPLFIRMLEMFPALRRIPARLIGLGIRPEHVKTTAASPEHAPQGTQG